MRLFVFFCLFLAARLLPAQNNFELELEEFSIPNWNGIHSAAMAQSNGKLLVVGGRNNGLHGYLPSGAFPGYTQNPYVYVLDLQTQQVWEAATSSLPDSIREHIRSSNMQFYQDGNDLYFLGGYGHSAAANDFITFPRLTRIDVDGLMQAVQNQSSLNPYFEQISDTAFAVTGAHLHKSGSFFYLVFGHKFDGMYNHTNGATFTQRYTEQIRIFQFGSNPLKITNYGQLTDAQHFHRRDYNLVPQVFPSQNNAVGMTAFTGVFQPGVDLPYFNSVDITPWTGMGYVPNFSFQQKLNQYHTAVLPIFDSLSSEMHTLFFGGIGQFYPDSLNPNIWVEDTLIPFVKTISLISRSPQGTSEQGLALQMPGYLGTNAQFVPNLQKPYLENSILRLHALDSSRNLVGYIVGGIETPLKNVFKGQESESFASTRIFRVFVKRKLSSSIAETPVLEALSLYPNPASQTLTLKTKDRPAAYTQVFITDMMGRKLADMKPSPDGTTWTWDCAKVSAGIYYCNVNMDGVVQILPFGVQ